MAAVGDADAVVGLVALFQAAEDGDGVLDRGRLDHHRLEAPLERGVFLDVLPVLVEGRRADEVQLAPRQHRLEHVGGVHGAFRGARADHGMELVDEENDVVAILDLLEHRLQTLFELAAVLGAGHERPHVEGDHALFLQRFGHVPADDALGEALHDRRLADAGLADENGVVLGAPAQDLDDAANLIVPADDRIELAFSRQVGEVSPVLLERGIGPFGGLASDPLRPADFP